MIHLTIYGEPVPQGRPKFARVGSGIHTYDPERSRTYKQLVRFWATQELKKIECFKPYEGALCVDITFHLGIPVSWSKKKRTQAVNGELRPVARNGDIDNLIKAILDSCNGLIWADDSIITDISARKRYTGDLARVEIKVTEVQ